MPSGETSPLLIVREIRLRTDLENPLVGPRALPPVSTSMKMVVFPQQFPQRSHPQFSRLPYLEDGSNTITAHMKLSFLGTCDPQVRNLEAVEIPTRKVPLTGMALGNR